MRRPIFISRLYRIWKFKIQSWFDRAFFVTTMPILCVCVCVCSTDSVVCCIQYRWNCPFKLLMSTRAAAHKKCAIVLVRKSWRKKKPNEINYKCHFFLEMMSLSLVSLLIFHMSHFSHVFSPFLLLLFLLVLCSFDLYMERLYSIYNGACVCFWWKWNQKKNTQSNRKSKKNKRKIRN